MMTSGRRLKSMSLLLGIVLSGVALLAWSQPWFVATLTESAQAHKAVTAGGDVAAPALAALALAALAGVGAMAISGRVFRVILALLQILVGGCIVLSAIVALASPISAVEPLVTAATSVTGHDSVAALIASIESTPWPIVALIAGALLAVLGVAVLVTGGAWPGPSRKYEPVRLVPAEPQGEQSVELASPSEAPQHTVSDWDSLSGGSDPTER